MANWTRTLTFVRPALAAVVAAALLAACNNDGASPSQPSAAPTQARYSKGPSGDDPIALGLTWDKPRKTADSVSEVISPNGGTVNFGSTGLRLVVPPGAVSVDTRFTITALPGSVVAYDFEPHGSVFPVPLQFVQDLKPTNADHVKLPAGFVPQVQGAYFYTPTVIDESTGLAQVQELIPATSDVTFSKKTLSFPIYHFSGYMISTGRGYR